MQAQMSIMRDIIYGAVAHGADFTKLCHEMKFDPQDLNDSARSVAFEPAAEIWNVAIRHTKDPLLGLHLGEEISPTILGMIGYLMQSSQTLHEAIIMLCKYNELYSTMFKYTTENSESCVYFNFEAALLWQERYPESARQSVEISMAGVLKLFQILSGKKVSPIKVQLAYPSRERTEYERIFQSVIEFNSDRNSLTFRKADMLLRITSYDKSLFAFFDDALEQKQKSLRFEERFSDRVKQMIIRDFKGRIPAIEIAASNLNMTVRSLQRKLKVEETSYRSLAANLKKDLAKTILSRPEFRISEVANMLGYSDSSAFRKAFKKWERSAVKL